METKVNSSVVGNRVTMKLGPSVVPVGTESILVLCSVPLHHFISSVTAGSLVDKWTGLRFHWGVCVCVFICHLYLPHRLCFLHLSLPLSPEHHPSSVGKVDRHGALSVFVEQQVGAEQGSPWIKGSKLFSEAKALIKNKMVKELLSGSETKVAWHSWCPNGYLLLCSKVSWPHQNCLLGVVFGATCPSAVWKHCVGTC